MSQFLSQSLGQQMRMEQRLTPQLIQSMSILQKPIAELEAYLAESLENNPALEIADRQAPEATPVDHASSETENVAGDAADFARLDRYSKTYEQDLDFNQDSELRRIRQDGERDAKLDAMSNTAGRSQSLTDHLLEQWPFIEVEDAEVQRAGVVIINHIDPDGYLRIRSDALAAKAIPPLSVAATDKALQLVKTLDPAGVGAADLVECLLLQIDRMPGDNGIERELVTHCLDHIAHNRIPLISKQTGYSVGELNEAIKVISKSLTPQPGYLVGGSHPPPIRPDVIVEYAPTGGNLTVRLTQGQLPTLAIREDMADLSKNRAADKSTREFAKRHIDDATAIIDAVKFRGERLLEVARMVVERQREFFNVGPSGLKVLRMSDVAAELQCDPSTISRTVADKYLQSPRGIFPLRYFFTGGTDTEEGDSTSWDSVKLRVEQLIAAEDRKAPFTDEDIAAKLSSEGIDISRRTVAKYRQQLNIPSTRQRRVYSN